MNRVFLVLLVGGLLLLIDTFIFQGVEVATRGVSASTQTWINWAFWGLTALTLAAFLVYQFANPYRLSRQVRSFIAVAIFAQYFSKLMMGGVLLLDEGRRLLVAVYQALSGSDSEPIARSALMAQLGMVVGSIPAVAMAYGILSGAHDYRVRRREVPIKGLSPALDGLKLAHISDIHAGSFWNQQAVGVGIDLLNAQKPDVVCFTGDLVNNRAGEMDEYKKIFSRIEAPLGVYSVLGNHDYGDYVNWPDAAAKADNLRQLMATHREMGWDLLMNEHRILEVNGARLAILGIENWSAKGRFPQYGRLDQATAGLDPQLPQVLLSHDPSHWPAEVLPNYPGIDLALAGHTHGMQFGVDTKQLKWSPVQYFYEHWADLYEEDGRFLYVNRGFGYLGYPGRIGMPPEITLLTLRAT